MNRLPAVALTACDFGIYVRMACRLGLSMDRYMLDCFIADNRDADLMLILLQWRDVSSRPQAWNRALSYALAR